MRLSRLIPSPHIQIMTIAEAFKASVRDSVAKGNHARWGEVESTQAISAVVKAAAIESGLDETEATALADNIYPFVKRVVNPSAFAQSLDGLSTDHPSHIRRAKRGSGGPKNTVEV